MAFANINDYLSSFGADRELRVYKLITEWLPLHMDEKRNIVKMMIDNKNSLGSGLYWTKTETHDWIIDTNEGSGGIPYRWLRKDYETVTAKKGLVEVVIKATGQVIPLLCFSTLDFNGIKCYISQIAQGFHSYNAVPIKYTPFNPADRGVKHVKMSYIVKGMTQGYRSLLTMGDDRVMEMHHISKNKQDNSDTNLMVLFYEEHKHLPLELK